MAGGFIPNTSIDAIMEPDGGQRELFRRYRKRRSSTGLMFPPEATPSESFDNAYPERTDIVKEEFTYEEDALAGSRNTPLRTGKFSLGPEPRDNLIPVKSLHDDDDDLHLTVHGTLPSIRVVKQEPEEISDSGESSFSRFGSVLQSALQGFITFPELILRFETCCNDLAEHVREEATERHRAIEDRLMRQKAQMLHDEAATWLLIWNLFGKESVGIDLEEESLPTSQHEACEFITSDETAQICFRVVKWLEGLASISLDLDKKHKGWYAGSYLQKLGVWRQTQRSIRKMAGKGLLVQHLDPDAPTREKARIQEEDQTLEEELLEDVWRLIRAGKLEEARHLCRSAGQSWRAATLGGCGDLGPSPSTEMLTSQGRDTSLQAVELESGISHQRRLWKWACFSASERISDNGDESRYEAAIYASQCGNIRKMLPICRDWESACWALFKSWLEVQVDMELARLHPSKGGQMKNDGELPEMSEAIVEFNVGSITGPDSWPQHVLEQQPRDLQSLFQKLISGDLVHENVSRSCKEQQRQIQMNIILGEVGHLLDLLRSWIVPPEEQNENWRSHGHPQMIRFGAHLVLVLRHILAEDVKQQFREKLWLVGDLILNTYAIFLFTQRREELVGIYAAQLAPYLCEDLYLHMMELRQNDSILVKYKIFRSAIENLPFGSGDPLKGNVSNILDRLLTRSRQIKPLPSLVKDEEIEEYHTKESLQKAVVVQWLCFMPPSDLENHEQLCVELLARAVQHSNLLLREFALISLRRNLRMPVAAHNLLGYLVEPLNHSYDYALYPQYNLEGHVQEIQEWREYFTCDALYRSWLKIEMTNSQTQGISVEEKELAFSAANEALTAATAFLQGRGYEWLSGHDSMPEYVEPPEWIELHAIGMLLSPSGSCLVPDATVCTALRSSLYTAVSEETVVLRELRVETSDSGDNNLVNVHLRCLPVKGDGIGNTVGTNGGLLAQVLSSAVKGEMNHFQAGLVLEVSRLDAWFVDKDDNRMPAAYITQGLCRRCCLPELILRCMQMRVSIMESDFLVNDEEDLVDYVASSEADIYQLFSPRQLQEFLYFEREYTLQIMELAQNETF